MIEFAQTPANLTAASQNLLELIKGRNLLLYPAPEIRAAMLQAVASETSRGWHITKLKQSHRIDIVIAMMMAALFCVREGNKRDLRMFALSTYGQSGDAVEIDPQAGRSIKRPSRIYRDENGVLRFHGDNSCTGEQIKY